MQEEQIEINLALSERVLAMLNRTMGPGDMDSFRRVSRLLAENVIKMFSVPPSLIGTPVAYKEHSEPRKDEPEPQPMGRVMPGELAVDEDTVPIVSVRDHKGVQRVKVLEFINSEMIKVQQDNGGKPGQIMVIPARAVNAKDKHILDAMRSKQPQLATVWQDEDVLDPGALQADPVNVQLPSVPDQVKMEFK